MLVAGCLIADAATARLLLEALELVQRSRFLVDVGLVRLAEELAAVAGLSEQRTDSVTAAPVALTIGQYAVLACCSEREARRRAATGRVPAEKVKGRWQVQAIS